MSLGGSKAPAPIKAPPERKIAIEPEDIQIGDDANVTSGLKKGGKRSLLKPAGGATSTGLNI